MCVCVCEGTTYLERGEHNSKFSVLEVRLHEVVNEVNLCGKVLDTRPHDDELEQWKQVIHVPLILNAEVLLYHLSIVHITTHIHRPASGVAQW